METLTQSRAIDGHFVRKTKLDDDIEAYTFVASTSDPDRHRTVLNQDGWELDNFRANPIIGYQHNLYGDMCNAPDPDDVIGKGARVYVENGELMVDIVFDHENEKARKIESKVDRGFLNTVSVGFIEKGEGAMGKRNLGQDVELYYFDGQELLEVSIVNIPSNPKAAKRSLRSQTFDALNYIYRELGGKFKFSEIEDMRIGEVLDLLEGREVKVEEKVELPPVKRYMYKGQILNEY
jgi:hypothetical protein